MNYIQNQGVNGTAYALIALDSHNYTPVGVSREDLIKALLAAQVTEGGWALSGDETDVDITAMVLQALAPYYESRTDVKSAYALVAYQRFKQGQNRLYDMSDVTIESASQPTTPVCISLEVSGSYKNLYNVGDELDLTGIKLTAYTDDYSYEEGGSNYGKQPETKSDAKAVDKLITAIGTVTYTDESKAKIDAARTAYDALTDLQKKLVENLSTLEAAETKLVLLNALGKVTDTFIATGDYMVNLGTPGIGSIGGEWMVIGLTRSGRTIPNVVDYYSSVVQYVQENIDENERLHSAKSTENSRLIIAPLAEIALSGMFSAENGVPMGGPNRPWQRILHHENSGQCPHQSRAGKEPVHHHHPL